VEFPVSGAMETMSSIRDKHYPCKTLLTSNLTCQKLVWDSDDRTFWTRFKYLPGNMSRVNAFFVAGADSREIFD
jgi:hypothetical protein